MVVEMSTCNMSMYSCRCATYMYHMYVYVVWLWNQFAVQSQNPRHGLWTKHRDTLARIGEIRRAFVSFGGGQ